MAELRHQIPINATPEKVYAALSTQAGLRGWWTVDATADEKVGGKADFGFDKRQMVFRMCNSSWGELMHRLRDYAEGKKPGPHWKE
jgi:Activator of Hsp90 ATPase homolog 1-like protein